MNIRFYKNFSKRKNSTKRPSASDNYNDRNCHLKEDTSIDNPSIVLSNREGNMSQTGNPITTSNAIASNANSCSVSFSPTQTYNGYNKPWAPGTEKNKLLLSSDYDRPLISPEITRTYANEKVTLSGTSLQSNANFYNKDITSIIQTLGTSTSKMTDFSTRNNFYFRINIVDENSQVVSRLVLDAPITINYITGYTYSLLGYIQNTGDVSGTVGVQIESGNQATTWQPYENICAINGKTNINLNVNGNTISEPFGQTVYGGVWNVITGSVRDDWDVIASYNGESLPGEWLSTMDLYSSVNPPTTGAEVVYKVTTPTSFTIPGHVVPLNEGSNTISANADSITINYDISTSGDLPLNYSYAYIDKFKKYYFVSAPVVLTDGTIQYDLEEDPLASHKTEIGSTVAHIAYSSTGWDKDLTDNRIAV